jgi:hypothetical protein
MTRESLVVDLATAQLLKLCQDFRYQRTLNHFGFLRVFRRRVRTRLISSAAVGCLTVDKPTRESVCEAGRLAMKAWLRLNQRGYGFQPISSGTVLVLSEAAGCLPQGLPNAFYETVWQGRRLMREQFGLDAAETPAWIFRTGLSPLLPPKGRNLRLAVSQILDIEGNGAAR